MEAVHACRKDTVYVSTFYIDKTEITKGHWDSVHTWAVTNGYYFDSAGEGKGADHPVYSVSWYDAVKWCNARSEMEGLVPCYYEDAGMGETYSSGRVDVANNAVLWSGNGYRLPTEAEWEKAARGGFTGWRFPWGNEIAHTNANYYSQGTNVLAYDISPTQGYHPSWRVDPKPYTSVAGSFPANGYGLFDVVGNLFELCWDWWQVQHDASVPDPVGPDTGTHRIVRSSPWDDILPDGNVRVSNRSNNTSPEDGGQRLGFRCVRRP